MKRFIQYVKNAHNELVHKVAWPTLKALHSSTVLVMVASLLFAVTVLCMDLVFENAMKGIYNLLY
jgi:preprotein translocase subunit SecE